MDRFFFRFVTKYAFVRQTDRQTEFSSHGHVCIPCRAVIKTEQKIHSFELFTTEWRFLAIELALHKQS